MDDTPLEAQRLVGKCGIVTGGGNGIGEATAFYMARNGAKVVVADLDGDAAAQTAEDINAVFPNSAVAIKSDVSSVDDNKSMIDLCEKTFERVDFFFANAGVLRKFVPIAQETEEQFLQTLQINTMSAFMGIKYASEAMKKVGGGSIICTSSIAAIRADLTPLQYAASKGAVLSLVQSANDRLLLDNVRVNAVLPGFVGTQLMMTVPSALSEQGLTLPGYDIKRFPPIEPEAIAKIVTFLASDDSGPIKGQAIVADGGMSQSMGSQPYPKKKIKKNKKAKL
mmetsp:Transcript_18532/g.22677  ORF Transcript_18532/g.22677 Transcript_18532/m.22677 type:complete len:281 (+) Transcript_18532:129-971(+)|eukprot:CAMPEP_0204891236 /NCGR_PEP_ID=MMETSP1349-20130617/26727_1 /ASSEMBLY_ACC=CAM_ASM_000710 /TAXON_ID=215587 /ORGANISM="Aplanochytrium stocchinoi, Strain GSBS06" /LENGTH=280 /DNA_ID=CAMNT_0052056431 /DNA_START=94 /DNA_END=936 /DNA_ORIENTATION=-